MTGMRTDSNGQSHANRVLATAAKVMLSQPTPYEGLYLAYERYIQWIDVERDLPAHLTTAVMQWCALLFAASGRSRRNLLAGIRSLEPNQARRQAMVLLDIVNELQSPEERIPLMEPAAWRRFHS